MTPDWQTWTAHDGKPMAQEAFALFLERNLPNIAEPAGAVLLEVATTLEGKSDVAWKSHKRLDNGQVQIRYEETIDAKAGGSAQGQVDIPTRFVLGLAPFVGMPLVRLEARLRWQMKGGAVAFWFDLVRPDDVLRAAFEQVTAQVCAGVKVGDLAVPVLAGAAPATQQAQ